MRLKVLIAVTAVLMPTIASAQAMNAEIFHKRATRLMAKGPLSLFSRGEFKVLMKEGQSSGQAAGARNKADKAAGRVTRYCAPAGPQKMDSDEFMKRLGAIPRAERVRIDMTEATNRIMAAKFPCR